MLDEGKKQHVQRTRPTRIAHSIYWPHRDLFLVDSTIYMPRFVTFSIILHYSTLHRKPQSHAVSTNKDPPSWMPYCTYRLYLPKSIERKEGSTRIPRLTAWRTVQLKSRWDSWNGRGLVVEWRWGDKTERVSEWVSKWLRLVSFSSQTTDATCSSCAPASSFHHPPHTHIHTLQYIPCPHTHQHPQ